MKRVRQTVPYLLALKVELGEVLDEHGQHVGRVRLLRQLGHLHIANFNK